MKRLIWIGKSYDDLKEFPPDVRHAIGYALYTAQIGKMHEYAKVLSGMGNAKVIEIREKRQKRHLQGSVFHRNKRFYICFACLSKEIKIGNFYPKTGD